MLGSEWPFKGISSFKPSPHKVASLSPSIIVSDFDDIMRDEISGNILIGFQSSALILGLQRLLLTLDFVLVDLKKPPLMWKFRSF